MLVEVEGFIIKETPYGETSKIINVLYLFISSIITDFPQT